jgi:hypothetical protein
LRDLRYHKRPQSTLKELDERIAKIEKANVTNKKSYAQAKAEYGRFASVHRKLFAVNKEHEPKPPQRQKQRAKGYERE